MRRGTSLFHLFTLLAFRHTYYFILLCNICNMKDTLLSITLPSFVHFFHFFICSLFHFACKMMTKWEPAKWWPSLVHFFHFACNFINRIDEHDDKVIAKWTSDDMCDYGLGDGRSSWRMVYLTNKIDHMLGDFM